MRDDMAACPNPQCLCGLVHYRGSTGPTGDDPSDDERCPVCDGAGQVHQNFARLEMVRGFCRDCNRLHLLGVVDDTSRRPLVLCYQCWCKRYHPELVHEEPEIDLADIPF